MKVNNWELMTTTFKFQFSATDDQPVDVDAFQRDLLAIPGVKSKKGYWEVPYNAASTVDEIRKLYKLRVSKLDFGKIKPIPDVKEDDWNKIATIMVQNGLREEYIDGSLGFPLPFQREGLLMGWNRPGISYWYSTGSGKSYVSIAQALKLPGLVIFVTRSAARIQMQREIERFVKTRAFVIRAASSLKKTTFVNGKTWREFVEERMPVLGKIALVAEEWKALREQYGVERKLKTQSLEEYLEARRQACEVPFVVVGWEALHLYVDQLISLNPTTVIFDEAHLGKGTKRNECVLLPELPEDPELAYAQSKADEEEATRRGGFIKTNDEDGLTRRVMIVPVMNRAAAGALLARNAKRRIALTATPTAGFIRDMWAQLDFVEPNAWGNKTQFQTRYCDLHKGQYGFVDKGASNLDELMKRALRVAHRVPMHVAQAQLLNKKRRQSIYVSPEDQDVERGGFNAELKAAAKRGEMALREVRLAQSASKKRSVGVELITANLQSNQKVCVFTGRKKDAQAMYEALKKANKGAEGWWATGDLKDEEKQRIVDEYMTHAGPCFLVATLQAFGAALNLHDTDAAYFIQLPYDTISLKQGEGRFVRFGMKRAVVIYYLIAEGTIDEHIASILIDKLPLAELTTDDKELGDAEKFISGMDKYKDEEEFALGVLNYVDGDYDGSDDD